MSNNNVIMIGSLPMSLSELQAAPSIIAGIVKRKGYNFKFVDINLELFKNCNQDIDLYQTKIQMLQSFSNTIDTIIDKWNKQILAEISTCQYLMVNVFSHFSQSTAYRFIKQTRKNHPNIKIFVGGIGSQKLVGNINDTTVHQWVIEENLTFTNNPVFGKLLLDNKLIDHWQTDQTANEIEDNLPNRLNLKSNIPTVDFSIYDVDAYQWNKNKKTVPMLGSYGCVRQCSFCDVIAHFPKYSFIEADSLTKSIVDAYGQTGIAGVIFMDSLVNGSMTNFLSLLKNLKQSKEQGWLPNNFSWSGTYICREKSTLLDQIHKLLPASGVEALIIGVESGSDRVRFDMNKKFTNQDLIYELNAFKKYGVKTTLLFFPSWPTETIDDFDETIKLFYNIAEFAHCGVVESVSLGTSGFGLIDGTHIEKNKDKIGLEPGPVPFLWKCSTNPDLNFWETIRRRFVMAYTCEYLGISLDKENTFLNYLDFYLKTYSDVIRQYAGPLPVEVFNQIFYPKFNNNQHLKMTVVNSNMKPVSVELEQNSRCIGSYECPPGLTDLDWNIITDIQQNTKFNLKIRFSEVQNVEWKRYENGDYYSNTGIYLDNVYLDNKNITLWGWNQLTKQLLINPQNLPTDYSEYINQRAVTQDTDLIWHIPSGSNFHSHLLETLNCEEYRQRKNIKHRLFKKLHSMIML